MVLATTNILLRSHLGVDDSNITVLKWGYIQISQNTSEQDGMTIRCAELLARM